MQAAKCDVLVAFFAYGGNGGVAMQLPAIGQWWARVYHEMATDPRIGRVACQTFADTPITMTRNRAVEVARAAGFDVLVMIDSDNELDLYNQKWWSSSFEFVYERLVRQRPTVCFAPYCGPPPHPVKGGEENVYVFKWQNMASDEPHPGYHLLAYGRDEAARLTGIQPAAAGPTGAIIYTLSAFDLQNPPHFYYEWTNREQSAKASTEDVTNTRDISMMGWEKFHEDVVFCNWDCWAGHHKPKCVGKPSVLSAGQVSRSFAEAVLREERAELIDVDFTQPEKLAEEIPLGPPEEAEEKIQTVTREVRKVKQIAKGQNGQRVLTMGEPCPEEKLQLLTGVVKSLKSQRPLRILQAGCCWVGEETLALLHGAPGATVYCLDDWSSAAAYGLTSDDVRARFVKNIGKKLDKQVKLVTEMPEDPQGLDVVVVKSTADLTATGHLNEIGHWMRHLAPHGLLVGIGLGVMATAALDKLSHRVLPQLDLWLLTKADYERDVAEAIPSDGA